MNSNCGQDSALMVEIMQRMLGNYMRFLRQLLEKKIYFDLPDTVSKAEKL